MMRKLVFLAFCTLIVSCSREPAPQKYDLNGNIAGLLSGHPEKDSLRLVRPDLCALFPQSGWDTAYIVHPFTTSTRLKALDLDNFNQVKKDFRDLAYNDHKVGFLFVQDHRIVFYSMVDRKLDFSSVAAFAREDCTGLHIETKSYEGQQSLVVKKQYEK